MFCVALALLLPAVAVHVMVVVPSGNGADSGWPSLRELVSDEWNCPLPVCR
jgi:hypothetical protein